MNLRARFIVIAIATAMLSLFARPAAAASCEDLANLALPQATITTAQRLPAGSFAPPNTSALSGLPAFCRVAATLKPTPVSAINIEVWLPLAAWNGKFEAVGNGGVFRA